MAEEFGQHSQTNEEQGNHAVSTLIADWKIHCDDIENCARAIFETANVRITDKGFADPTYLALTLLARTVSNLKGAKILLEAKRIVEARTITRCCLENLYWTVGLAEHRIGRSSPGRFGQPVLHRPLLEPS